MIGLRINPEMVRRVKEEKIVLTLSDSLEGCIVEKHKNGNKEANSSGRK